jgi:hypothetical protein
MLSKSAIETAKAMAMLTTFVLGAAIFAGCGGSAATDDDASDESTAEAPLTASEQQAQRALETRLANSSWAGDGQSPALGFSVKRTSASALEYKLHRYACFGPGGTECEHATDHGSLHTEWRLASGKRSLFIVLQPWSTSVKGKDGPGPTQVYLPGLLGGRLELTPYFGTCTALGDTGCTTQGGRNVWAYFVLDAIDVSTTAYCAGEYWVANPQTYAGDADCDWAASVAGPGASSIIGGACPWVCSETLTSTRESVDTLGRCMQRCP